MKTTDFFLTNGGFLQSFSLLSLAPASSCSSFFECNACFSLSCACQAPLQLPVTHQCTSSLHYRDHTHLSFSVWPHLECRLICPNPSLFIQFSSDLLLSLVSSTTKGSPASSPMTLQQSSSLWISLSNTYLCSLYGLHYFCYPLQSPSALTRTRVRSFFFIEF